MIYVYDLETYPNFFLASFKDIDSGEYIDFEISDRKNQLFKLRTFLSKWILLVGFNNLGFDYPVLHNTVLRDGDWTAEKIYAEVEKVIAERWSAIPAWEVKIEQIDLYKIWHYDNKNKATSLKWLEFAMRWENVQDLPYAVGSVLNDEQKDLIILYCHNDIDATEAFYKKSSKHIELRKFYTSHEKLDLMNASEIKMSKEIFAKHLSVAMGRKTKEVKKMRTYRKKVDISSVIFDYITFDDPINNNALETFKSKTWINLDSVNFESGIMRKMVEKKNSFAFSTEYLNVRRDYAEGGLHSFGKPGIYKSDEEHVLVDVDFASFYPHISFRNNLHPRHIPPKIFNELYEGFYHERKKYPKSDPRNYVLKIILNGSYGLSKDAYSFLYDPKWQLEICINGQLLLTKLTELVVQHCKQSIQIIFENTDGAMYRIKRTDLEAVNIACKQMEEICKIPLEIQECKKIIARDVNNYINVIDEDNIKYKGVFEIDRDYHKNHSKRIVPLALANYFINGIDPRRYITSYLHNTTSNIGEYINHGIYDFCIGAKMKYGNKLYERIIRPGKIEDVSLSKITRYYVSTDGNQLIKKMPPLEKARVTQTQKQREVDPGQVNMFDFIEDNTIVEPKERETNLEVGYNCIVFNKYEEKDDYNIDYEYYINECNKIIKIFDG